MLRQLAQYHAKDPNNLFMVRLAQVKSRTLLRVCQGEYRGGGRETYCDMKETLSLAWRVDVSELCDFSVAS